MTQTTRAFSRTLHSAPTPSCKANSQTFQPEQTTEPSNYVVSSPDLHTTILQGPVDCANMASSRHQSNSPEAGGN
ncbi:unnamed protein product [Protopolystoma xenopodis]|uniref:Uncharacterized protein n=1 Tax=Protopolystoma xenopodis TaxID=117903 RepID=A0A448WZJ5_9PLAT|nr:unnamed protein product [Protopolystoma xenopodis]